MIIYLPQAYKGRRAHHAEAGAAVWNQRLGILVINGFSKGQTVGI